MNRGLTALGKQLLTKLFEMGFILDLSHISDEHILSVAEKYDGRIIVSHCACSDLYSSKNPRSNSLTRQTITQLVNRVEIFGVSFLNDIISANANEFEPNRVFDDILTQTCLFIDTAGSDKVAFGPDYLAAGYFSRKFKTNLMFPDMLLKQEGLIALADRMSKTLLADEIERISAGNVKRLLRVCE
jgi:membrane dipeptidase